MAVHVADVPRDAAERVLRRVAAAAAGSAVPLTAFGLLQHEAKMSVVNFSLHKVRAGMGSGGGDGGGDGLGEGEAEGQGGTQPPNAHPFRPPSCRAATA